MKLETRKMLDKSFSGLGFVSVFFMAAALVVILLPIMVRGFSAYCFVGTVEFRKVMRDHFERGDTARLAAEIAAAEKAREPVFAAIAEMESLPRSERRAYSQALRDLKEPLQRLLGPLPGEKPPILPRSQYGENRWERAKQTLGEVLYAEEWIYPEGQMGYIRKTPRRDQFRGTPVEKIFPCLEENIEAMLRPRRTFYWRFLTDTSKDANFFGGIRAEVLGTLYLTIGAMIFAIPIGVIAAIYLCEYARPGRCISLLRTCISTLAGVPSIVFGLFGLAFFLNTLQVSHNKSVLAGSLTLALMILPTIIRSAEEAILAVPMTYREAALGLGAGRWHTVLTVVLPAALPGILTGTVISMGRAAGETAPIIFTAAVSVGRPLSILEAFHRPTPALPWNIYNLCTEHEAVDQIRHVQYGMVATLVVLVLLLNLTAIFMRARISRRLRG